MKLTKSPAMSPSSAGWRWLVALGAVIAAGMLPPGSAWGQASKAGAKTASPTFVRGDADADGSRDIDDAVVVLEYLRGGPEPACLDAADANDDGSITSIDAKLIIEFVLGPGGALPPPQQCGSDPTFDHLDCRTPTCTGVPSPGEPPAPSKIASKRAAEFLSREYDRTGAVSFQLRPMIAVPRDDFFTVYAEVFGLDLARDDFRILSEKSPSSDPSFRSTKFEQIHDGLRVVGAEIVLVERHGRVAFGLGRLVAPLPFSAAPVLGEEEALSLSHSEISRRADIEAGAIAFRAPPHAELVIASKRATWEPQSYRLAWRCVLPTSEPAARYTIDIDAWTGEVLFLTDGIHTAGPIPDWADAICHGTTLYEGPVDFIGEWNVNDGTHRLQSFRDYGIVTFDNQHTTSTTSENDFVSPTDQFHDAALQVGVSAHWAAERTLRYLQLNYGFIGADGMGGTLTNRVRWRTAYDGAHSIDAELTVAYGDFNTATPVHWVPIDVVAHEITHAVTYWTARLVYAGESGALNESFSDIIATTVERDTLGAAGNWSMAEDLYLDGCCVMRWMDMPKGTGKTPPLSPTQPVQPTTYLGANYVPTTGSCSSANDQCGVHTNSGVQNRWFYLLSEGGSGIQDEQAAGTSYQVDGIGTEKAARIAFTNLTTKLSSSATFAIARTGSVVAAQELYGEFSQEHVSVENAWHAVGVGSTHAGFVHDPSEGQTAVDPWPVSLKWEAGNLGQDVWDLEVSVNPHFVNPVFAGTTLGTIDFLGKPAGQLDLNLKPGTTYYWRVREHSDQDDKGWRPAKTFHTSDRTPKLVSPRWPQFHYPWKVTFEWEAVPGAGAYQVEVASTSNFRKLIFPTVMVTAGTSIDLPARVGTDQHWRVRALPHQDDAAFAGGWASESFKTTTPHVALVSPAPLGLVYPWPAEFQWSPVVGAIRYLAEISTDGKNFGENVVKSLEVEAPATDAAINVKALKTVHWWRVTASGPRPESLRSANPLYPSWPETVTSDIRDYQADADATTPIPQSPNVQAKLLYGSRITFGWKRIKNAESFMLTFWRIVDPVTWDADYTVAAHTLIVDEHLTGNDPATQYYDIGMSDLTPGIGTWGYLWEVRSFGPEGLEGYGEPSSFFWVRPDQPLRLSPAQAFGFSYLDPPDLCFSSQFSPSGKYLVELSIGAYKETALVDGIPPINLCVGLIELAPDQVYGWRVQAWDPPGTVWVSNWSDKWTFKTEPEPEPAPPPPPSTPTQAPKVPPEMWGVLGQLPTMFTVVPGADRYRIEVYLGKTKESGGTLVFDETFTTQQIVSHMYDLFEDLNKSPSSALTSKVLIAVLGYASSGKTYYYRVRGCAGGNCGPVSAWSKFTEASTTVKAILAWNLWLQQQGAPQI